MKSYGIPHKALLCVFLFSMISLKSGSAQMLHLPNATNYKSIAGRTFGNTEIEIRWNAPGVKGREGQIWGTSLAYYGYSVLGYGSNVESPWRAGADESTTISFSTDVRVNGKNLPAGKYSFFIALYPDSCVLIFNKNVNGWGSYFYDKNLDVLRVTAIQQKNLPLSKERLEYTFSEQTQNSVVVALEWEKWRIPFKVEADIVKTTLASIQSQMSGAMGFDPPSMEAAANWCYTNNVNLDQALTWIMTATDPAFGGLKSFGALSTKSGILRKLGKINESEEVMALALKNASPMELHQYGRQLLAEKKVEEAFRVFEQNYNTQKGNWPTGVGMMRAYSAKGNIKKALEFGKNAIPLAPNAESRKALEESVKILESGKFL